MSGSLSRKRRLSRAATALALLLCSCGEPAGNGPEQHWVVLERADAQTRGDELQWEFDLKHPGRHVVQVVTREALPEPGPEATVKVDGKQQTEKLRADYTLKNRTVSEFKQWVSFTEAEGQTLSITLSAPFEQVRLVPHFSNEFQTRRYYEQWLAMHRSPEKQAALERFKEARFGMFIHWGIYAAAAGSWHGVRTVDSPHPGPKQPEWLMSAFQIPRAEYEKLAGSFEPDRSFARNFARLAKDTGMKYVVMTSKHHDGFAMFDSQCSDFDVVDRTPYKADTIRELYEACRAEGLDFGVYYSHGNDWRDGTDGNYANVKLRHDALGIFTHPNGKNLWDPSPNTYEEYLESKAYPQVKELLKLMPELNLLWFDGTGFLTEDQAFRFYKLAYDLNPSVIVNRRVGSDFGDYLDAGDNVIPSASAELAKHWETCGTTNNSWGHAAHDTDWKSTRELLYYFIDIASKGGNYLLNIGPDKHGRVPEACARHMREMGEWVRTNGDAIYGTTRWKVPREGQDETRLEGTGHRASRGFSRTFTSNDFWFTSKDDKVYAMALVPPDDTVHIRSLNAAAGTVEQVRLLGSDHPLQWKQSGDSLDIDFRDVKTSENGFAVEVVIQQR